MSVESKAQSSSAGPADTASAADDSGWQPNIVALVCRWCTYAGADLAGTSRLHYPATVRLIRFPCTGRMNPVFILKAFENGADGVLVSGCHPGDCHYVQGNLYARRRFTVFRALMEFVGVHPDRLQFSWVSASEGSKWVRVVQRVSQAVRDLGPAKPIAAEALAALEAPGSRTREADVPVDDEPFQGRLRQRARELLDSGQARAILGYGRGTLPGQVAPVLITRPDAAEELIWNSRCVPNLAVHLPRLVDGDGKLGVVLKQCDAATVTALLQERRLERDELCLIGLPCSGVRDRASLAMKCHGCDGHGPAICDVQIQDDAASEWPIETDPRDAAIDELDARSADERRAFWHHEFERCIRCYACRAVCPLCYCDTCISEKHRPQWISPAIEPVGNAAWNVVRAFHLAGRCTGCDECARACPADIRLDLLNRKLARVVAQRFGYRAGVDSGSAPPLTEFRSDDPEEFIL